MSTLADLKKSISEMESEAVMQMLLENRRNRRRPSVVKTKTASKKDSAKADPMGLLENLSSDQIAELLARLEDAE